MKKLLIKLCMLSLALVLLSCDSPNEEKAPSSFSVTITPNNAFVLQGNVSKNKEDMVSVAHSAMDKKIIAKKRKLEELKNIKLQDIFTSNISFTENKGQLESFHGIRSERSVKYYAKTSGSTCYFSESGIAFGFVVRELDFIYTGKKEGKKMETMGFTVDFLNCNKNTSLKGRDLQVSKINYLKGNDPNQFVTDISSYKELLYSDIYKAIDLKYYLNGKNLKYDYLLHSGADVSTIQMQYNQIKELTINSQGELEIHTEWGILKELKPFSYQVIDGKKKEVKVVYKKMAANKIGFEVKEKYDRRIDLIIDPVIPTFVTFTNNGNLNDEAYNNDIVLDAAENIYFTGTASTTMPGSSIAGSTRNTSDIFAYKLSSDGTTLIYATIMGAVGSGDIGMGIDVNSAGEVFIAGFTSGADYPVTAGASQTVHAGGVDMIYTRLNAAGNALVYSTFHGGTGDDRGYDVEVNSLNEAFIVGTSSSSGLATAGVHQTTYSALSDGFVVKYDAAGVKTWFTYFGGTGEDQPKSIAINSANESFISGATNSTSGIAVAGAYISTYQGGYCDGFVAKFNSSGQKVYSTYLGGVGEDWLGAIRVNSRGEAFVVGTTDGSSYPVLNAYQNVKKAAPDAVITALSAAGTSLLFSTFFGGSSYDNYGKGTSFDQGQYWRPGGLDISDNVAMAVVVTQSSDLALYNPIYVNPIGNNKNTYGSYNGAYTGGSVDGTNWDSYIISFDYRPAYLGSDITLLHASYLGEDIARDYPTGGIRLVQSKDTCYVVSVNSHSQNFPTTPGSYNPNGLPNLNDQPTMGRFCIPPIIMPVNLISYKAYMQEQHRVLLEWITSSEKNNDFFLIEKSDDGIHFTSIGKVTGYGNSSEMHRYSFTDENFSELAYYRLKQVDIDGAAKYNKVISVGGGNGSFEIYPNPATSLVSLSIYFQTDTFLNFVLINQLGQVVYSNSKESVSAGIFAESISIENLPVGIYTLQIFYNQGMWSKKILKE